MTTTLHPALPGLDERQRAMLSEMGINVWWPAAGDVALSDLGIESAPAPSAVRPATEAAGAGAAHRPATAPVSAPAPASARPAMERRPTPSPSAPAAPRTVVPLVRASDSPDLAALDAAVRACQACDLGQRRHNAVPGMGDPHPDWLVVGEAPGEEEDRQGLPFVGRAGQLLDRMLAAMDLSREQKVYIANVIKCRPPHNRNPDPVEIAQCLPHLLRQVELLQPKIVMAMGRFAAHTLLAQGGEFSAEVLHQMPLGKLRGRVHQVQIGGRSLPVVVTYHPAYLLRSPAEKGKAWADLCLAMDAYARLG